jgi:hypothetical protein
MVVVVVVAMMMVMMVVDIVTDVAACQAIEECRSYYSTHVSTIVTVPISLTRCRTLPHPLLEVIDLDILHLGGIHCYLMFQPRECWTQSVLLRGL